MKAAYVLDQSLNIRNASDEYRKLAKPVIDPVSGGVADWIVPKGAVVEGDEALLRVKTGQAAPIDEECAKACGMSTAELSARKREYLAASAGIKGKKDMELFMAGVIDGYLPGTTDEKPVYKPGENWAVFEAAKQEAKAEAEKVAI